MHTNYDVLGMAELSGQILGLTDTEVLDVTMNTQTKKRGSEEWDPFQKR